MTNQQRNVVYEKYIQKYPGKSNTLLAEEILTQYPAFGITQSTIAKQIGAYKKKVADELPDEELTEEDVVPIFFQEVDGPKWTVSGESYHWDTGRGAIDLPVAMIDQLFYDYSEYGLNLTQTEVINKYNLKVWQWHSIKRTLELYKKSNIFSPWTVQQTPADQLNTMIQEKMEGLTKNFGYQVVQQYNKAIIKSYKQSLKEDAGKKAERDTLLLELQDLIPQAIKEIKPRLSVAPSGHSHILNSFLFDIHYGAEVRTRKEYQPMFSRADRNRFRDADLPDYSPELCEEMMETAARKINAFGAKEVHLWFGGDNIETFTGMNHTDSWRGIAKGYYGAQLVTKTYKMLCKFISKVNNVVAIHAVPGNHDRATQKADQDGQGWIAEIIFELIRLSFGEQIPVNYQEKVVSEHIDGIQYIMSHGHLKLTQLPAADMVLKYGDAGCFNLHMSGHLHNRQIKNDSVNFTHRINPSVFPGNDYSVDNGWGAAPGFTVVHNDGEGKPRIIDIPF